MKRVLIPAAVLCVAAFAGSDAIAERQPGIQRPTSIVTGMEAISIPRMLYYQGRLTDTFGLPVADTTYSVEFRLYTVPSGGSSFWDETQTARTRSGLFAVLLGASKPIASMPDAGALYLGMAVAGGAELTPRLRIVSAAYAYKADTANYAGAAPPSGVAGGDLAGSYPSPTVDGLQGRAVVGTAPGYGQVLKWNGNQWAPANDSVGSGGGGGTVTSVSQATGVVCSPNPITTTGTVGFDQSYGDGRYVNVTGDSVAGALAIGAPLRVHDKAALGYSCYNSGFAAFCAGYGNNAGGDRSSVTGGEDNSASGQFSHIGGGSENIATARWSTIGGGNVNEATDTAATVGGGRENFATAPYVTVSGGSGNAASDTGATVGGGYSNGAYGRYSTIGGGASSSVAGDYGAVGGGYENRVSSLGGTVAGGYGDSARARYCAVLGGKHNVAGRHPLDTCAAVCGGQNNSAETAYAFVGGGSDNTAGALWSAVAGGHGDTANGVCSFIGGGENNKVTSSHATVSGGYGNAAAGDYASVGGGYYNGATGSRATVGGGGGNSAETTYATVGGGNGNNATRIAATIGGGNYNVASGDYATVGGGHSNDATAYTTTIGGGNSNSAAANCATVGGGYYNNAAGTYTTVGGGYYNDATASYATVGGGRSNDATGSAAMVPGGYACSASGARGFAAGSYAKARGTGSFVWSDSCDAGDSVRTATDNRWVARARGGVYFYTNLGMTTGSYLSSGGSSWNSVSDSMTKENFRPVDKQALLEALARMRVRNYNLRSQDASIRHIGPVAQDFYGAFGFGESNTAINMEDADGVALAAIQALYEQNQMLSGKIDAQQEEIEALKTELRRR